MPTLKEITTRAKKIRKAKPRTKWQNAIKQASKELKAKYRKKEGKVAAKPKRKRVVGRKKVATTKKRITGYKGWTIKGTHNIIYGVVRNTGKVRKFLYITTSYTEAEKYRNYRTRTDSGRDLYLATYIKEFIV